MKSANEQSNIEQKLHGPVDDLFLLRALKDLCIFIFQKTKTLSKKEKITDAIRVITALNNWENKLYQGITRRAQENFSKHGLELGKDGISMLKFAIAIGMCITILDSDSEEWKEALTKKLQETKSTLKKMSKRLKDKEANKRPRTTSPAVEVIARSHRQRRERENELQSNATSEKTGETSLDNGF